MSNVFEFRIEGIGKVKAALDRKHTQIVVATTKGLREAGELLKGEIQARAPVRTGALRESVRVIETQNGCAVGPEKFYARFLEFGTSRMSARPFIRPAFEENKEKLMETIAKAAKGALT